MIDEPKQLTTEEQSVILNNLLVECAILRKWIDEDTAEMTTIIQEAKEKQEYIEAEVSRANNSDLLKKKEDEVKTAALALYALTQTKKQPGVTIKTFTPDPKPVYDSMAIFQWAIKEKPGLLTLDIPKFEEFAEAVKSVDPVPGVSWTVPASVDKPQIDKDLSKFLK